MARFLHGNADQVEESERLADPLVGGPPKIATRFEETISNPAREKLAGRLKVEV